MIVTKEEYIKNVVDIYTSLLNQTVRCVNAKWDDIQLDMTHEDFRIYYNSCDEVISGDFEEQYVYTILGVMNMASVRSAKEKSGSNFCRPTEVDVVEFLLNDEEKAENPNSSKIQ